MVYSKYFKRILDICISFLALVILLPLFLVVAILVKVKLGSPAIFKQERPGLHGKIFTMYKFRSMTNEKNIEGELLPDKERLTKFGVFLRKTSLDELPELFNILKGDMSLVGPRPLLVKYLERYDAFQARRHEVRPGLTGWAQINGRNAIKWEEKFKLDVWYVDNWNFWIDIKIMAMTAKKVFIREGIDASEEVIMNEFMGTDK